MYYGSSYRILWVESSSSGCGRLLFGASLIPKVRVPSHVIGGRLHLVGYGIILVIHW